MPFVSFLPFVFFVLVVRELVCRAWQAERSRHLLRRAHQALVQHHHRDRRAADRVDAVIALTIVGAHPHAVLRGNPRVLGKEALQIRVLHADHENRLLVGDDRRRGNRRVRSQPDQHRNRFAGVGRHRKDLVAQEDPALQRIAGIHGARTHGLECAADASGLRKHLADRLDVQRFEAPDRSRHGAGTQQYDGQQHTQRPGQHAIRDAHDGDGSPATGTPTAPVARP